MRNKEFINGISISFTPAIVMSGRGRMNCDYDNYNSVLSLEGPSHVLYPLYKNLYNTIVTDQLDISFQLPTKIIFSNECAILLFGNDKTIVRCDGERFDHEKGILMVMLKRYLSKREWSNFLDEYREHPKKEKDAAKAIFITKFGKKAYLNLMDMMDRYLTETK